MHLYKILLISKMILIVDWLVKYGKKNRMSRILRGRGGIMRPVLVVLDDRSGR